MAVFAALLGPGCSQEDPSGLLSLAASAIATGDARTAVRHYQDAATLSPSDSFIRWQLTKTLLTIRDGSGAVTAMEDPITTVSQPQITGIIPTLVSVQVLPPDPLPDPPEPESPPGAAPTEVGLVAEPAADEPIEETPTAQLPNTEVETEAIALNQVKNFVLDWAAVWSRQDVDAYLSHYAEDFRPASDTSHTVWREQRRERLMRPRSISVEISELEVIPQDAQHVQARFVQNYRANHYRDRDTKTLALMREGGEWRIVRELSL